MSHDEWGGEDAQPMDLRLDIYAPVGASGPRPALMAIHGGGFTGGSRTHSGMVEFATYFAERGFVAVSIDYRLQGDRGTVPPEWAEFVVDTIPPARRGQALALYPAARDARAALRWLSANADTYGVSADHITTLGGSAGSYLAIMLGITEPSDYTDEISVDDDPTLASTNLSEAPRVATIIDHWGGPAHVDTLDAIWGLDRYDAEDPPICIVHGTEDETVGFEQAEDLRDTYLETGAPFAFHALDGLGHGPWSATIDGATLVEVAFDFVVAQQELIVLE